MKNGWVDGKFQQRKGALRKNEMKILELKNTAYWAQQNKEYLKTSKYKVAKNQSREKKEWTEQTEI